MAQRRLITSKNKQSAIPRPSASVILVSPRNQILLLHRVQTSSAFPSAYVFAGGNLSEFQDGQIPGPDSPSRHVDSEVYRRAAIRETFEESGILLAKRHKDDHHLISIRDSKRERKREAVHANEIKITDWMADMGAHLDTDGLLPFTRWITPSNVPKRFTTQMYLYFLPLEGEDSDFTSSKTASVTPSSDGGLEHTTAEFKHASDWLSLANPKAYPSASSWAGKEIIMFPPQFFLLHLLAPLLPVESGSKFSVEELAKQRDNVKAFLQTSSPPWPEKCISPMSLGTAFDGRSILGLHHPGLEGLVERGRKGDDERIVLTNFTKAGPAQVEVYWKKDIQSPKQNLGSRL